MPQLRPDYEALLPYCETPRQVEIINALISEESQSKAAKLLNIHVSNVRDAVQRIRTNAAKKDANFHQDKKVPDGFGIKGVSTLYDEDGNKKVEWVKSTIDRERQEQIIRETAKAFMEDIKPLPKIKCPKIDTKDLLTNYCIGDAHLGMLAWHKETGEDFDTDICRKDLLTAITRLIESAPKSEECLIVQLGDFYHVDNHSNSTPQNGNPLQVDSRFQKIIRIGIDTLRETIKLALSRHHTVRIRNVAGNHDPTAAITLTEALRGFFHDNPRVIIEDSPKAFWAHKFGKNLIGIAHGHAPKPDRMPGLLAGDYSQWWGETEFKYCWHGHIHNKKGYIFEDMGVIVESFRTLATNDAWHTEQGYRSGKEMQAIILHKDYGEIERHTAGLKYVREVAK